MKTEWIRVEDRLPERRHFVLVYEPEHENIFECYIDGSGEWAYVHSGEVAYRTFTHWAMLPEPPERTNNHD